MDHERSIAAQSERHAMQTYEDSKRESAKGAELAALRAENAKLRERAEGLARECVARRRVRMLNERFFWAASCSRAEYEDILRASEATDAAGWLEAESLSQ